MRLLIAEDEKALASALAKILKKNNYSVDVAFDGEQALNMFETEEYDAILLDIMMPKIDGIKVLKTIRQTNSNIPIVMLTAKTEIGDKVLGLDSGANDYLEKPFDTRELLARIRAVTRTKEEVNNKISFGNTILNRKTFELEVNSKSIKLTNKEFQMIEMFFQNKNAVVSAGQFMDKVWSNDLDVDNNSVWVYISYLRKKLLSLDSNVEIKATRSVGYYLEIKNDK